MPRKGAGLSVTVPSSGRRLRIFVAIRHAKDPKQYFSDLWTSNFYPALRRMGHDLVESQVDLLPASDFMQVAGNFTAEEAETRAGITQAILDEVRAAHREKPIDLFLSYFYNAHFDPAGFADIRALGIPTVNFYCNSMYQFDLVAAIAPAVDFAWHAEMHAAAAYRAVGANPVWVQMAADPDVYRPYPEITQAADACFVGQRYADRDRLLYALHHAGVPLTLHGRGWSDMLATHRSGTDQGSSVSLGRPVAPPGSMAAYLTEFGRIFREQGIVGGAARIVDRVRERRTAGPMRAALSAHYGGYAADVAQAFAGHAVVLNFSNVWSDGKPGSTLIPHVRLRDFEGPMSRACYLTGYTDEIEHFFEVGREIDCYRSAEELVDKTRFYLSHPDAAEALREAGWRRARRDHRWENRFQQLFAACGLE
ncbi:MAG: glycosyltransferase [Sphingomonas sp.]